MTYRHLARHANPSSAGTVSGGRVDADGNVYIGGRKWDLRSGTKSGFVPGFFHSRDGRYLAFDDGKLVVVHPDGRRVSLDARFQGPRYAEFVGPYLALTIAQDAGLTILDGDGKRVGNIPLSDSLIFGPFNPHDGKTIWTDEQHRIVQWDVATQRPLRTIAAPEGKQLMGLAVLDDGHVATFLRDAAMQKRKDDRLTVFDPNGEITRSIDQAGMSLAALGADKFVVCDDFNKRFVVYDRALEKLDEVEMFEPGREVHAQVVPLPSGREWIAIGGRGEWDHYGEPSLAPTSSNAPKKAAVKKVAEPKQKKPAVKRAKR